MLLMRKASFEDVHDVYRLSNEPAVRKASLNSEPIDFATHISWFKKTLKDPEHLFLLFYDETYLVAQIRFHRLDLLQADISISISEKYRGQGVGTNILRMAISELRLTWDVKEIKATIKNDNVISLKFFEKNGFKNRDPAPSLNKTADVLYFDL